MFKKKMKSIILLLLFSHTLYATEECVRTKEYMIERHKAFKKIREPYNKCVDSMHEAYYWKAMAKCRSEGKGENIGGGCGHLVTSGGFGYSAQEIDTSHCNIFKPKKSDLTDYLNYQIKAGKLKKCKN